MDITLLFPLGWMPYAPYAALPRLTAYLRSLGHNVVQRDLNVEMYDVMLQPAFLQKSLDQVRQFLPFLPDAHPIRTIEAEGEYLVSQVEHLVNYVRSEAFYGDPATTTRVVRLLNACLRLAIAPHYPARCILHGGDLYVTDGTSADDIRLSTRDEKVNFIRPLTRDYFLDSILDTQPRLVGISISSYAQLISGLTLATLIKERQPDIHVVLGGNTATRLVEAFDRHWDKFDDVFDSLVIGEGELALVGLTEALEGRRDFQKVPGLMYRADDGNVQQNLVELPDLDALPTPDFDGLPLDKYFSPVLLLPIASSRGCHWGKCTFCDRGIAGETIYQFRKNDLLIEDIRRLQAKYQTRYFELVEDDMPPLRLEKLARQIIEAGLDIRWCTMERLEKRLTPDVLETIYQAGCHLLRFGLESGDERVLGLINKGIDLQVAERVLRDSTEAGIWNECFVIVGFPTEEPHEVQNSIDFIKRNRDSIQTIQLFPFFLSKYSAIGKRPADFEVQIVPSPEDLGFRWSYNYTTERGLSMEAVSEILVHCWRELGDLYPNRELWTVLSWEHFFLYLCERGVEFCKNAVMRPDFDSDAWQDRCLRLSEGVIVQSANHRTVIQDVALGRRFALKPAAHKFLQFCQDGMPAGQAMHKVAQDEQLSPETARQMCLAVLEALVKGGSICWND